MSLSDALLSALMREPLTPIPPEFRSARQAAPLAETRAMEARSPDTYWAWVAERFRWSRPWHSVRDGGFGDLHYFAGGTINVAAHRIRTMEIESAVNAQNGVAEAVQTGRISSDTTGLEDPDSLTAILEAVAGIQVNSPPRRRQKHCDQNVYMKILLASRSDFVPVRRMELCEPVFSGLGERFETAPRQLRHIPRASMRDQGSTPVCGTPSGGPSDRLTKVPREGSE